VTPFLAAAAWLYATTAHTAAATIVLFVAIFVLLGTTPDRHR
jgi:hypothetical protein